MNVIDTPFLTIFTPAYNRANTLPILYNSLKAQTLLAFKWLIVDDGSSDNTCDLVASWISEGIVDITYLYQENSGKPSAHNTGVLNTETDFFFCVDSDDYLPLDSVRSIYDFIKDHSSDDYVGILAYKALSTGKTVTNNPKSLKKGTLRDLYDLGLTGDTALIFKTAYLKDSLFPKFPNEKFIPEAYLYDIVDQKGCLLILPKVLYICEYLPDGYTANMAYLLYRNPNGYFCYINQRLKFDKTVKQRFVDSIRYVAMAIAHERKKIIRNSIYPYITFFAYLPGYFFYFRRYKKLRDIK